MPGYKKKGDGHERGSTGEPQPHSSGWDKNASARGYYLPYLQIALAGLQIRVICLAGSAIPRVPEAASQVISADYLRGYCSQAKRKRR